MRSLPTCSRCGTKGHQRDRCTAPLPPGWGVAPGRDWEPAAHPEWWTCHGEHECGTVTLWTKRRVHRRRGSRTYIASVRVTALTQAGARLSFLQPVGRFNKAYDAAFATERAAKRLYEAVHRMIITMEHGA